MPELKIMPSLLAADPGNWAEGCLQAERGGADGLHLDIMDGHFVPNMSMGPSIVAMARKTVSMHLSVHLMITRPDKYAEAFLEAGADTLQIHVEADCEPGPVLKQIRERGVRAGIVINPDTPVDSVFPYLDAVDEVLFMTVHPGFGGQAFIEDVLPKMQTLRERQPDMDIAVDGGINVETAARSASHGANIIIAGTSLYRAQDMKAEIGRMREAAAAALRASRV